MPTQPGIDILLKEQTDLIKGKRVGLLAHSASVDSKLRFTPLLFHDHPDIELTKLFAPEHGLFGNAQDMESVNDATDPLTGLSIVSLYGSTLESLSPTRDQLKDIDILVCDLQDIGSRYYTYIYTMALCLKACAAAGKPVIVLDRPNPLGGVEVEGNLLKPAFASFVGLYPLPARHGMTIGELAMYFNETQNLGCELTVIPMKGWRREQYFDQTGLAFVPPSPNIPTLDTALVYPGLCLVEATDLSEGRGTTRPFEWIGAPFIEPLVLANALNNQKLPGVWFRPVFFRPGFQKLSGQTCGGVHIHVRNRNSFRPYLTGLTIIHKIRELYPNAFSWREQPYEFEASIPAIDLLTGDNIFRDLVDNEKPLDPWVVTWPEEIKAFLEKRRPHLLY